jgi:hypothetical protein
MDSEHWGGMWRPIPDDDRLCCILEYQAAYRNAVEQVTGPSVQTTWVNLDERWNVPIHDDNEARDDHLLSWLESFFEVNGFCSDHESREYFKINWVHFLSAVSVSPAPSSRPTA